jgi:hypothetical protein
MHVPTDHRTEESHQCIRSKCSEQSTFIGAALPPRGGYRFAQLGVIGPVNAQAGTAKPTQLPTIKPGTNTSFTSLKRIDAGLLNVGYAEAGPAAGPAVVLLHGWPAF